MEDNAGRTTGFVVHDCGNDEDAGQTTGIGGGRGGRGGILGWKRILVFFDGSLRSRTKREGDLMGGY